MDGVFRDPSEGVQARRADLLRRRRADLATMGHAARRVYVSRVARSVAGLVGVLSGSAVIAVAALPDLALWLEGVLPGAPGQLHGGAPAVLATLLLGSWVVSIAAYLIARSIAEHRFAVRMSKYVLPSDDLAVDVERLDHEHPDAIADQMAHRLEIPAFVMPVAAAAALWPMTALYGLLALEARGYPLLTKYELLAAEQSMALGLVAAVGFAVAGALSRLRLRPGLTWASGFIATASTSCGVMVLLILETAGRFHSWLVAWSLLGTALVGTALAVFTRRLRVERALLQTDDPAAGAEVFSLTAFVRKLWATGCAAYGMLTVENARRVVTRVVSFRPSVRAIVVGAMVATGVAYVAAPFGASEIASVSAEPTADDPTGVQPDAVPQPATTGLTARDGSFYLEAPVSQNSVVTASLPGLRYVPPGWRIAYSVTLVSIHDIADQGVAKPNLDVVVSVDRFEIGDGWPPQTLSNADPLVEFPTENCGDVRDVPATLAFALAQDTSAMVRIRIDPVLSPAACEEILYED